jgi:hypothetical protein
MDFTLCPADGVLTVLTAARAGAEVHPESKRETEARDLTSQAPEPRTHPTLQAESSAGLPCGLTRFPADGFTSF